MDLPSLSIVVPAKDEAARIGPTLEGILAHTEPRYDQLEVIVVDDGSTDGTGDVIAALGSDRVRVVRHDICRGKGAAVRSGLQAARNEWTLMLDADLSVSMDHLEQLAALADAHDIVIGSKWAPGSDTKYPPLRRALSIFSRVLVSTLAVSGFRDTQCGFKLFRTEVTRRLLALQRIEGYGYDFELLYLAKRFDVPVAECPIRCDDLMTRNVSMGSYARTLGELLGLALDRMLGRYPRTLPPGDGG
jgi:dolichyl-phosphate beta-glucosyltransferase